MDLTFGKRIKSHGAKSSECGGLSRVGICFSAKNLTHNAVCAVVVKDEFVFPLLWSFFLTFPSNFPKLVCSRPSIDSLSRVATSWKSPGFFCCPGKSLNFACKPWKV